MRRALALVLVLIVAACKQEAALPEPVAMTDEALGHYCQMYLADHPGPKAQAFLDGHLQPLWFSQVSDAAAFRGDAEKPAPIVVIYVSDMGTAESWSHPGAANWIAAETASFVVDSTQLGGMGLPEAVPFASETAAAAFVAANGGRVVRWDQIPDDYARKALGDGPIAGPDARPDGATDAEVGQ